MQIAQTQFEQNPGDELKNIFEELLQVWSF